MSTKEVDDFSISVLNRAKAFTLRRMTGSLERRIRKVLARFSPTIKKVRLVLEDENGPRGGTDKRASLQVTLANGSQRLTKRVLNTGSVVRLKIQYA